MKRFGKHLFLVAAAFVAATGSGVAQTRTPMGPAKPPPPKTSSLAWRDYTVLMVTVTDTVNQLPVNDWQIDVFDPVGNLVPPLNVWQVPLTNTWGILLDKDYSNQTLTALATASGYSSQSLTLNCAGEFIPAQFILLPFEWQATLPLAGGVIGPFGSSNVTFTVLPNTFDSDVVVQWRNLPPEASTVTGIPTDEFTLNAFSVDMRNPDGTDYDGGWYNPLVVSMQPQADYNADPWGETLTYEDIFSSMSVGYTYTLVETGPGSGTLLNEGQYYVDTVANTISIGMVHNTTFVTTGDGDGKITYDTKTKTWTVGGIPILCGPPIPVCTQLTNGLIRCGEYKGGKFSYEKKAGEEAGDLSEILKKLEADLGADFNVLGAKIKSSLSGALSAKIASDGKASSTTTISYSLTPDQAKAGDCESGDFVVFQLSYESLVTYGDKTASIVVPFGISCCYNIANDPSCGEQCVVTTPKGGEKKEKLPCCGD
jgi:hypothetical protein